MIPHHHTLPESLYQPQKAQIFLCFAPTHVSNYFTVIFQVRQNPKENSFFVQGLKKVAVGSYKEIEKRTDEGRQI